MWTYIFIFVAKLVEVSFATIRNVLINRGQKIQGACIGFFEVLIWVLVVNQVLSGLNDDPLKLIVFCLAFSCGNYVGVIIEERLAIGNACVQVIVKEEDKTALSAALRDKGFGVTIVRGEGKNGPVNTFMIYVKRKSIKEATDCIYEFSPNSLVIINDVRHLKNGYIKK